jgi:hypothetical protein
MVTMFTLAWASCDYSADTESWRNIVNAQAKVVIAQGDTPYSGSSSTATTQADALAMYQTYWSKPSLVDLMAQRASNGMLMYWQPDDHEWGGDDWDHTLAKANTGSSAIGAVTQAHVNSHFHNFNQAQLQQIAAAFDNPPADASGNTERPSGCTAEAQNPPTTNYPIKYFHRDFAFSGTLGGADIRVIFLDLISYTSPASGAGGPGKRKLGAQQEAWLMALLNASASFSHVIISATKPLLKPSNSDGYGAFETEAARLLTGINTSGIKPIWITGDTHRPHVNHALVSMGAEADLLQVLACPLNSIFHELWSASARTGSKVVSLAKTYAYGFCQALPSQNLSVQIRDARSGSALWQAEFAPYSNTPIYPPDPQVTRLVG